MHPKYEVFFGALSNFSIVFFLLIYKDNFLQSPLKVRKSDNNRYRDIWESDKYRESNKEKHLIDRYQRRSKEGIRAITLQGALKKYNIAIAILEKGVVW